MGKEPLLVVPRWSETSSRCGEDIARDAATEGAPQTDSAVPRHRNRCILTPMSKPRRNTAFLPLDDTLFVVKQRKAVPHEFVLDAFAPLSLAHGHATEPSARASAPGPAQPRSPRAQWCGEGKPFVGLKPERLPTRM
jgi:hypothetical protein